jgi:hypothetical protein
MCPSWAPFHGIVRTETIQFEVTNFKITYNALLGWVALSKFMAILHYAYMVLKLSGLCGVISIRGDVKRAFDCDRESCEITDRLLTSAELQELKQALSESPPPPPPAQTRSCLRPRLPRCPSSRRTHSARQSCCPQRSLPMWLTWVTIWIQNRNSRSSNSSGKMGTSSHGILVTCWESLGN